jgi:glutaredoxin
MLPSCPHCKNAMLYMEELRAENPEYASVPITTVNEAEQPDLAKQYEYFYVPTFYLDKQKLHEGVPSKDIIRGVFDQYIAAQVKK